VPLDSKIAAFIAGIISASFGAGVTFAVWNSSHPTEVRVEEIFHDTKVDAHEARASTMRLEADLKTLRKDLSRGFGRAYAPKVNLRDDAGKRAVVQYEMELRQGTPPDEAMRHLLEETWIPLVE
jgi:hypothetical protein